MVRSVFVCLLLFTMTASVIAQENELINQTDSTENVVSKKGMKMLIKPDTNTVEISTIDTSFNLVNDITAVSDSTKNDSTQTKGQKKPGTVLEAEITYHARDSIRFGVEDKKVYLFGEAQINYQDIELKAAYIEIDQETKEVYAEGLIDSTGKQIGKPQFKSGDQQFSANRMRYNFETEKGKILDVITQEGEGNIRGEQVKKTDDGSYYIKDGGYTTCDAEEPHYMIKAKKLKVIPNDKVVSGPAFLMFEGVYTPLVIPFGWFPTKKGRKSGIIFPTYGESPTQGFFFQNFGYYFNLGDKIDLEATGDIYTRGSYAVRLISNYKKRYKFNGRVELSHNSLRNSRKEFPDYSVQNNFFVRWKHQQDPKARPSTSFSADVNFGTATNFNNGLISSAQDYLTNTFRSSIAFSKRWIGKPYTLNINFNHSQNTNTNIVDITLPQVAFSVQRFYPFKRKNLVGKQRWYEKIGVSYNLNARNQVQVADSSFLSMQTIDRMRNGIQQSVSTSTNIKAFKYFTINPSVNYNERWFFQRLDKSWNNETQLVDVDTTYGFYTNRDVSMNVTMATTLYGLVQFKKGWIRGVRHMLNPSVGFRYQPKLDQDEVGYYGVNGAKATYNHHDLSLFGKAPTVNTGSLNYNINNTLEMKVRSKKDTITGYKKIKLLEQFRIGGNYNFFADSLNLSDINISGSTSILQKFNVRFNINLTPYAQDTNLRKINKWLVNETGQLTRITNASLAIRFDLNGRSRNTNYQSDAATEEELAQINANRHQYVDFNIPWNLAVSYNFVVNNLTKNPDLRYTQTLQFNGDVNLTPKWKVGFNSGYDFKAKDLSYTSLSIYRDLHCWEFSMTWVPFGDQQQWSFDLKVKSSILQDLKLSRKKNAFDF